MYPLLGHPGHVVGAAGDLGPELGPGFESLGQFRLDRVRGLCGVKQRPDVIFGQGVHGVILSSGEVAEPRTEFSGNLENRNRGK